MSAAAKPVVLDAHTCAECGKEYNLARDVVCDRCDGTLCWGCCTKANAPPFETILATAAGRDKLSEPPRAIIDAEARRSVFIDAEQIRQTQDKEE